MEGAEAAACGSSSSPAQPRCSPGGEAAAAAMEEPLGEAASPGVAATAAGPRKQQGVKRHHHKHNLKHRYELQETLGKGTYGKVKRAIERFSGRVVSEAGGGAAPGFRRSAFLAAPVGSAGLRAARSYAGAPLLWGWGGW